MTQNPVRRAAERLYGGINMSWPKVIIMALGAAALTAFFLIVPSFQNTSFVEMGTTMEAWIFLAVIIMVNCKKPLESALKTFVFFLISQPTIYLIQVPFSSMGWQLFQYYKYWFFWTLLTFPMAFAGWYLKKGNWLSLLILTPINILLAAMGWGYLANDLIPHFPNHLIAVLFCFGQIFLYMWVFFPKPRYWLAEFGVVAVALAAFVWRTMGVDVMVGQNLPGDPSFSSSAVVTVDDADFGEATLTIPEEGHIMVHAKKYGSTVMTIKDSGKTYRYIVELIKSETDENTTELKIEPIE